MTSSEKHYVDLTAKVTAQEAVKEFRLTLNCDNHNDRIGDLEKVVHNGIKNKAKDNANSIRALRRFMFWAIMSIVLVMAGGLVAAIFT